MDQVLVEEIDYGDEDSVKQATDLLLQKELASEVGDYKMSLQINQNCSHCPILVIQQVIQEHNVEQEIIQAEDDFKIIEHADIAMDDNLGPYFCWSQRYQTLLNSQCVSPWWKKWWRPRRSHWPQQTVRLSG